MWVAYMRKKSRERRAEYRSEKEKNNLEKPLAAIKKGPKLDVLLCRLLLPSLDFFAFPSYYQDSDLKRKTGLETVSSKPSY